MQDAGDEMAPHKRFFGRMNDPVAAASIKGACGEEIEFYLDIRERVILEILFYTEGCGAILACGDAVCRKVQGLSVKEALSLSPALIMQSVSDLPEDEGHCAVLAVMTFYKALGEYLLEK